MTEHFTRKGWVGITPRYLEDNSIAVEHVFDDSPAHKAGIRNGDFVRAINGRDRESDAAGFMEEYGSLRPGVAAVFDLERENRRLSVTVNVDRIPDEVLEDWIQLECRSGIPDEPDY